MSNASVSPLPAPEPPRVTQPEFIEVIVLGNNAESVFEFALAWARAKGWDMDGQDRVARIVVSMAGPPIITPDTSPTFWWDDLPEPATVADRKTIYALTDNVPLYSTPSANLEPTVVQLAAPTTRHIAKKGDDVQIWHKTFKDSMLICVFDGATQLPPYALWVKGEQMTLAAPLPK